MMRVHFILGATASGKGAVGREIARRIGAQILSVDSMKIYRRMNIGTSKPTRDVLAEIPHHCIDIIQPSESFSAVQYIQHADRAIEQIAAAGAAVLAVGGTSLYIKALSEGLFEGPSADPGVREALKQRMQDEGSLAMHGELARIDPQAASRIHPNDQRRIIRAIEVYQTVGRPISELQRQWDCGKRRYDCVFIGLRRTKEDLHRRINQRAKRMVEAGLKDEVAALLAEPGGLSDQAARAVGYAEMIDHLQGRISLADALEQIKINTRRLAKKQQTWHRRWHDVQWFDVPAEVTGQQPARGPHAPRAPSGGLADRIMATIGFNNA